MSGHRRWWSRAASGVLIGLLGLSAADAQDRAATATRSDVVLQALALLGTPYRYGGTSPELGLDCSGLVQHVFSSVYSWNLPRRTEDISGIGQPVSRTELQPGDLVFFNTLRRAFSHVAIYIGEGRFVHAPANSGRVRIEGLDDRYWAARFSGARRVIESGPGTPADRQPTPPSAPAPAAADRPPEP